MTTKIFLLLFFALPPASYAQEKEHKWIAYFRSSSGYDYEYDKLSVKKKGTHTFVWVKEVPIVDSIRAILNGKYEAHHKDMKWFDYSYTVIRLEIDCAEDKVRNISEIDYSRNGDTLENWSDDTEKNLFLSIPPNTMSEALETRVCK